jgi:excisionase family DNA binding protein
VSSRTVVAHETEYLSIRQAAMTLSVCTETIKRHLKNGKLRGVKVGRVWRIRRQDLPVPEARMG